MAKAEETAKDNAVKMLASDEDYFFLPKKNTKKNSLEHGLIFFWRQNEDS